MNNSLENIPEWYGDIHRITRELHGVLGPTTRVELGVKRESPSLPWVRCYRPRAKGGLYWAECPLKAPLPNADNIAYWRDVAKFVENEFERIVADDGEKEDE